MNKEFYKKLLSLVLPIAFQQFMLALVGASDALMLGLLSQDSLSAVSLAGQTVFVFNLFLSALSMGTSAMASQYWGRGDRAAVEKILASALRPALLISFLFFTGALFFPERLMQIFTSDPGLIREGALYLQASAISYPLCGISQIYLCIMKNSGHARNCAVISATSVVINLALNAALIFGFGPFPPLGIAGAAYATVVARAAEMLWAVLDSAKEDRIRLKFKHLTRFYKQLEPVFWKCSLPILGNQLAWGCGFSAYSAVLGHMGSDAAAANSIANIVKNLIICFCLGIAGGGSILVGNELGAGKLAQAKESGRRLCLLSIAGGAVSAALMLAVAPLVLRIAPLSGQAAEYLKAMFWISSYYLIGKSVNSTVIAGIFGAGGDTRFGLACDAVTLWLVTVPAGCVAAFLLRWPVPAVYFVLNLDEIIKLPAVYRHYKEYRWVKNLTEAPEGSRKRRLCP